MEIWQHLLILGLGASGLFFGGFIGRYTKSEIHYAQKWLILFNQVCALLLLFVVLSVYLVPAWVYVIALILFAGYVTYKNKNKTLQNMKHQKRTVLNYAFFLVFGILYSLVSTSGSVLLFSTILFLDSLAIGSLIKFRKKDVWEYLIPFAIYVSFGMISTVLLQGVGVLKEFL